MKADLGEPICPLREWHGYAHLKNLAIKDNHTYQILPMHTIWLLQLIRKLEFFKGFRT